MVTIDTVDHKILINELTNLGIEGTALELLKSYLDNRTVRVSANGALSEPIPLKYGIPQGSVLAPTLFTIYTRTLANLLTSMDVSFHIYADDTQIYFECDHENIDGIKAKIQDIFHKVNTWMSAYQLKLNVNKTKILIFGPKKTASKTRKNFGTITIGQSEISLSESVKNLGVIFDQDLNFQSQISAVIKSCNYALYNLRPIKPFLPFKLFVSIVHQEIISKVDYCNALYLQLPKKQLQRLQLVINRCVRLIFGLPRTAHITEHLKSRLHWLPIAARIDFKIILLTYKALNFEEPKYLFHSLLPTRRPPRLKEHKSHGGHVFIRRSFHHSGPRLYNKVPNKIKTLMNSAFKKGLKTFFYNSAFERKLDSLLSYYPSANGPPSS